MDNWNLEDLLRVIGGGGGSLPDLPRSLGSSKAPSAAGSVAKGGGLLLPMVSGLLRLFGGGDTRELPPLPVFELPAPLRTELGLDAGGETFSIDRGAGGRVRRSTPAEQAGTSQAPAQVTVEVRALDSQSFLDRREDIARAVREAMLESHSLNDVVSEI